ncbi:MAG: hypothetical protein RL522_2541 [Pseudomonadota bacterium]|jgi:uncharacterized protein (DUF2147 family)
MKKTLIALALSAAASTWAQMTPVGVWHSIDDKTGETKAEIRLTEVEGAVRGRIEKLLRKGADLNARCVDCEGDRKDQPVIGLEIIRGVRKLAGKDVWEGGKILDPENGRDYALRLTPIEGGRKLEVRGSIAFIGRTQTWVRVQ